MGVIPSSSLPVTANATPKRSLPIHILEKDTPLINCCQRKTGALFKPFAEPLPKQSPVSWPNPVPRHLLIFRSSISPLTGGLTVYPLSLGDMPTLSASKTTPPLSLPYNHSCALCARIQCYPNLYYESITKKHTFNAISNPTTSPSSRPASPPSSN